MSSPASVYLGKFTFDPIWCKMGSVLEQWDKTSQPYFEPKAWFRAVYADDTPVGFVMLYDDPEEQEYFLWRYMIAGPHHSKCFGRRGIELLVDYVRTRPGATVLETSCGQGPGSPEEFYCKLGFVRNGKMIGDEVGLSLAL